MGGGAVRQWRGQLGARGPEAGAGAGSQGGRRRRAARAPPPPYRAVPVSLETTQRSWTAPLPAAWSLEPQRVPGWAFLLTLQPALPVRYDFHFLGPREALSPRPALGARRAAPGVGESCGVTQSCGPCAAAVVASQVAWGILGTEGSIPPDYGVFTGRRVLVRMPRYVQQTDAFYCP